MSKILQNLFFLTKSFFFLFVLEVELKTISTVLSFAHLLVHVLVRMTRYTNEIQTNLSPRSCSCNAQILITMEAFEKEAVRNLWNLCSVYQIFQLHFLLFSPCHFTEWKKTEFRGQLCSHKHIFKANNLASSVLFSKKGEQVSPQPCMTFSHVFVVTGQRGIIFVS